MVALMQAVLQTHDPCKRLRSRYNELFVSAPVRERKEGRKEGRKRAIGLALHPQQVPVAGNIMYRQYITGTRQD